MTVGIIASTTSSALASIQSASRVLQALVTTPAPAPPAPCGFYVGQTALNCVWSQNLQAKDNLIPVLSPFAFECNGEPVAGILVSAAIGMG